MRIRWPAEFTKEKTIRVTKILEEERNGVLNEYIKPDTVISIDAHDPNTKVISLAKGHILNPGFESIRFLIIDDEQKELKHITPRIKLLNSLMPRSATFQKQ